MFKPFTLALLIVSLSSFPASGQEPPALETFISPDGNFQFVYPQTYELLQGERMLKATQGRRIGIPVCDFSTAMACLIYPVEVRGVEAANTRFEAAGLSVRAIAGVTEELGCLTYADLAYPHQSAPPATEQAPVTEVAINQRVFRHASLKKTISGHTQAADFYRTFLQQKCYELQIEVSLSEEPPAQKVLPSTSLGDPVADSARESLRLILSSVVFQQP